MTVVYGSPAYETLYTIFEWKSPDAPMRLRTSEGDDLARIMREGVVLGETQGPPCGTNVVYTNV